MNELLIRPGQHRYVRWGKHDGKMKWSVEGFDGDLPSIVCRDIKEVERILKVCQLVDAGVIAHVNMVQLERLTAVKQGNITVPQVQVRKPVR